MKQVNAQLVAQIGSCLLLLKSPVIVKVHTRTIPGWDNITGLYRTKMRGGIRHHRIDALSEAHNLRGLTATILHELIHAYCDENHPRAAFHGRTFQRLASALAQTWRAEVGPVQDLYIKGLDL